MSGRTDRREVIERVRNEIEGAKGTYVWNDYVNSLRLISQVVFTRSSGFILEFLQNAEDTGRDLPTKGVFEISVNKKRVMITHNGCPFTESDVRALCGIRSSKKPELGSLGYLGIGFKSVFRVSDCPEVHSNGYQFKFDRKHWPDASNTPWHVLPLWVDSPPEEAPGDKTLFFIPFRDESLASLLRTELRTLKTELYLFLKWVKRIKVTDEVAGDSWVLEDHGEDEHGITTLSHNGERQHFKVFRKQVTVPQRVAKDRLTEEYRANVSVREIAIAFALDQESNLQPEEAGAMYGGVYSFLPLAESRSGAKFPIQADFLVQPGRDAINYEAEWNGWLLDQVVLLCKEAISAFKTHPKWRYHFLPTFQFIKAEDQEAYQKLFGPRLIQPIEHFLLSDACIPTDDGNWVTPAKALKVQETPRALDKLLEEGILRKEEVGSVLGGDPAMKLVHRDFIDQSPPLVRQPDRTDLLENTDFLNSRRMAPDAPEWFRKLYSWLRQFPSNVKSGRYTQERRYHSQAIVLTSKSDLLTGGKVFLMDVPQSETNLLTAARTLESTRPVLHPEILTNLSESNRMQLRGFLTGFMGVQILDRKAVCREAILPSILTKSQSPEMGDLIANTRFCREILGQDLGHAAELWVLTKEHEIKAAREVLFAREYKPERDWETNARYVPGLHFLSDRYLSGTENDSQLRGWREFFVAGGIKTDPQAGVEEFAVTYAEEKLRSIGSTVVRVEKRNFGYDLEVSRPDGTTMRVEVKGFTSEQDVELTQNETHAADKYRDEYYVLVVSNIPEHPKAYLVPNPTDPGVGRKDKLTIPIATWKTYPA